MEFSDYIIYVDESGDHGMLKINPQYPIFVLSFCLFKIDDYVNGIVPGLQNIKFKYFGHDQIIFHEHEIRKQENDYAFLRTDKNLRNNFLNDISGFVAKSDFEIFAILIDKYKLRDKYKNPFNPYFISLQFGLEILFSYLLFKGQADKQVSIVFEKRGASEDNALELEFRRLISEKHNFGWKNIDFSKIDVNLIFADKLTNSSGLQLADLTTTHRNQLFEQWTKEQSLDIIKTKIKRTKEFPE